MPSNAVFEICCLQPPVLDIQTIKVDESAAAAAAFDLTISLRKTEVMFQPAQGQQFQEPAIQTEGKMLNVFETLCNLGEYRVPSFDFEIVSHIAEASAAFERLSHR